MLQSILDTDIFTLPPPIFINKEDSISSQFSKRITKFYYLYVIYIIYNEVSIRLNHESYTVNKSEGISSRDSIPISKENMMIALSFENLKL